jgi:hypothetical protein
VNFVAIPSALHTPVIKTPFDLLADAWSSGDADKVAARFHPEATWVIDG